MITTSDNVVAVRAVNAIYLSAFGIESLRGTGKINLPEVRLAVKHTGNRQRNYLVLTQSL
jgi:hypothetical protein